MAFTDTFEDLGALAAAAGDRGAEPAGGRYGFGAEGDWKTAALVRSRR